MIAGRDPKGHRTGSSLLYQRPSLLPLEPANDLLFLERRGQLQSLVEVETRAETHGLRVLLEGTPGPTLAPEAGVHSAVQGLFGKEMPRS
jgi:hypothetical protein